MTRSLRPSHPGAGTSHAEQIRSVADSPNQAAASALAASWRRSLTVHGLDPAETRAPERLDENALAEACEAAGDMLSVSEAPVERLFAAVGEAGCSVLLTDASGAILRRWGQPGDDEAFNAWGLWTGAVWSEALEGTNGIGTCLADARPVKIRQSDHFRSRNTIMSCMGAPVFDAQGALCGVIDVSSCRADLTDGFADLICNAAVDAARSIEMALFRQSFSQSRVVVGDAHGPAGTVLLAVDRDDLVIGATRRARRLFELTDAALASPRPLPDILGGADPVKAGELENAERAAIRRALARADGNASQAARELGVGRATLYLRMARLGLR